MTQGEEKAARRKKRAPAGKKTARPAAAKAKKPAPGAMAKDPAAAKRAKSASAAPARKTQSVEKAKQHKALYEDFDTLTEYLTDITGKSQEVVREYFTHNSVMGASAGGLPIDPLNTAEAYQEMLKGFAADPGTIMQRQFELWGNYAKLMATMSRRMAGEEVRPAIEPQADDSRFSHPAWRENLLLDFVKQSYLVFAQWTEKTVSQLEGMDPHEKAKVEFFTRQFTNAIAPTNFPMLNPEVVETTIETKGENLLKGLKNLLEDLDRGHGELAIRQADLEFFKLGENIATTPGKVIYQNEIMQLIQYAPSTEKVAKTPLLIVPPWINKYYILDLAPKNSFIKWMIAQGRTTFVISWVNPGPALKEKTFEDYIRQGLFEALDAVKSAVGEDKVDAIGYCIGGTMLSTALALMAKKNDRRINSATFFTAQADFSEAGDLLFFVDDAQLGAIEKQMDAAGGVLTGRAMATTFNMLRSNDLIWSFVIDNYMKGKDPAKFDLLFWNSDPTRMPKNVHLFYLREFYQHNRLAKGEMRMAGELLDLGAADIPIFMQAGETDHIAPHNSVYKTARLFASKGNDKVVYMLAGSGHIAGVINHPDRRKYHHRVNDALPASLEEWKAGAELRSGSWWPTWIAWLNKVSPGQVDARTPGDGALKPIEDAPGSYVKEKA
jgi:polyhydroxyalkanoate synthase